MPDPRTDQAAQHKLLQILDTLGTEHSIRSLLIGGTVAAHLRAITSVSPAARNRQ